MTDAPPTAEEPTTGRFEALTGLPPAHFGGESGDASLARSLLVVSGIRVVLVTLGLGLAAWQLKQAKVTDPRDIITWQYLVIGLAYGSGLIAVLALRLGRFVRAVAWAQTIADAAIVTAVVAMTGGADSVFTFTYVFVVLEGSVTLLRPGALVATTLGTALFGGVLLVQAVGLAPGLLPEVAARHLVFTFVVHTSGVGLVAMLAGGLAYKLRVAGRRLAEREEDLERLEELHAAILEALPAGLLTVDSLGQIRFGNEAAHTILRARPGELVGRRLDTLLPGVAAAHARFSPAESASGLPGAAKGRREETPVRLPDGATLRIGFSLAPLALEEGTSTIVVFQDLTEVARLQAAVDRAERLALVGKFAAGLAHEVRNPLASMCASIDVLEQTLEPPPATRRLMANVVREAARLDHLIRDFLALARPRKLSFTRVDLGGLVGGVLEMFENDELMQDVAVEAELEPGVTANADSDLVRQVVWNLVRNAAQAMYGQSEPRVLGVRVCEGDEGPAIEVEDTGRGLGEEQLRRAFDPFYTTKQEGSGLGLAICQSIIHAHGGGLELEGRPGRGARVRVQLSDSVPTMDVPLRDLTPHPELVEAAAAEPR